ncbi:type II secretion system protein N [Colwellia sp. Bg11-28]|uniref:type II secretion system protein N n=1 Tax=Colwellia sp. Bg11-28 TaxID=2058305 RepID=UPI000C347A37|nr:type II secretion system protein N [Colwellia sp. Bg11-28]PKH85709.1 general secretion pathway protein GspN [Colwellia sp. Bg11-28]
MKKWFAFTAIFLSSYIAFLVANTPLAMVINNAQLPKDIVLQGVSGSIWQGEVTKVTIDNNIIEKVKTTVSFWSLFSLSPSMQVTFGDAMLSGPEGKLNLTVSSEQLALTEVELFMSANDIAKQLSLPIPLSAQGNVELFLSEIVIVTGNQLSCSKAEGDVSWSRAGVVALEQNIKLGKFSAEISCAEGDLLAKVSPKNNLGLSFDGGLTLATQKISGKGYLKPGAKFPSQLRSALSFLGRPDNQGRYLLRF